MNIQAISTRTGVPAATLRKWEQRYGVLKPERTAGAHRRYTERDIARVEWLKARVAEGFRISEAARLIGDAGEPASSHPDGLVEQIVAAAVAADTEGVARVVNHAFTLLPAKEAVADVAEPVLKRIGTLWATGEVRIVDEHVVTELTRARIRSLMNGGVAGSRGRAVLCCVPGERHDCGLLILAVLMHADGWGIVYLGGDTPLAEAAQLAVENEAALLCVSATMDELAAAAEQELAQIEREHARLAVVRGGAAFGGEPGTRSLARLRRLARR